MDVHVPGGRASVPEPIRRWGLIQFVAQGAEEIGVVQVRIPPLGGEPAGILLGGGGC